MRFLLLELLFLSSFASAAELCEEYRPCSVAKTPKSCKKMSNCTWNVGKCFDSNLLCNNNCPWHKDRSCDDGGPNSSFKICIYGSDCSDCGPRQKKQEPVVPSDNGRYDIDLKLINMEENISSVFISAKKKLETIIIGDIGNDIAIINPNVPVCYGYSETRFNDTYKWDDILIFGILGTFDGPGGILGGAGPCRTDQSGTIRAGIMKFDTADVYILLEEGHLYDTILHEMMHIVGFGTGWASKRLINEGPPLQFNGTNGIIANKIIQGPAEVLIETEGGRGTARGHWKTVYKNSNQNEIMTGWLDSSKESVVSILTIASFKDMNYTVNMSAADSFTVDLMSYGSSSGFFIKEKDLEIPIETILTAPKIIFS